MSQYRQPFRVFVCTDFRAIIHEHSRSVASVLTERGNYVQPAILCSYVPYPDTLADQPMSDTDSRCSPAPQARAVLEEIEYDTKPAARKGDARSDADSIIDPRHAKRNFFLIIMNGVLTVGAIALFDPQTVIPSLVTDLTHSQALVGLILPLNSIGWIWPQLFVANWLAPKPKRLFVYRIGSVFRIGLLVVLAALMWAYRADIPSWFVYCLLGILLAHWTSIGFTAVGWYDVLGKTVYSNRRPALFAWRRTGMGLLSLFAGGVVVSWALSTESGLAFPTNYLFLLLLSAAISAVGVTAYCLVHEPADRDVPPKRMPWKDYFRAGPQLLKHNRNYRFLIFGGSASVLSVMIAPFLVPYLKMEVGIADSTVGFLTAAAVGGDLVANLVWGRIGTRRGNRAVLVNAARVLVLLPVAGTAAVLLPEISVFAVDVRVALVALALIGARAAGSGLAVGQINYLLDIAPRSTRPMYIGFMNAFSAVFWFMVISAGTILEAVGYLPVFIAAGLFSLLCAVFYLQLDDFSPTS